MSDKQQLSRGLKERHVTMLSIGGVIGAGLFVGSGHAIAKAGPAVIIAYVLAGALVVFALALLLGRWLVPDNLVAEFKKS